MNSHNYNRSGKIIVTNLSTEPLQGCTEWIIKHGYVLIYREWVQIWKAPGFLVHASIQVPDDARHGNTRPLITFDIWYWLWESAMLSVMFHSFGEDMHRSHYAVFVGRCPDVHGVGWGPIWQSGCASRSVTTGHVRVAASPPFYALSGRLQ